MEILAIILTVTFIIFMVTVIVLNFNCRKDNKVVVQCSEGATFPRKAHNGDASFDLCALEDTPVLYPGRMVIPTGIKIQMPEGIHSFIMPTSGNSLKGLNARIKVLDGLVEDYRLDADVLIGTIDSNYRGELNVIIRVHQDVRPEDNIFIKKGIKVAQLWVTEECSIIPLKGEVNKNTSRKEAGLGSTDKKEGK